METWPKSVLARRKKVRLRLEVAHPEGCIAALALAADRFTPDYSSSA
jgi:hypothetical protein